MIDSKILWFYDSMNSMNFWGGFKSFQDILKSYTNSACAGQHGFCVKLAGEM